MTEQQEGSALDEQRASSTDPYDVVDALDNLLDGCLADGGEQLLDHVEVVTDVVRSARDCIAGLAGRGPSAEEADDTLHPCVWDLRDAALRFVEERLRETVVSGMVHTGIPEPDGEDSPSRQMVCFMIEVPHSFGMDKDYMIETARREIDESGLSLQTGPRVGGIRLGGAEVAVGLRGSVAVDAADLGRMCRHVYCAGLNAASP